MDPIVIFDEQLEMAALVDADSMRALGPVGVGPNAGAELESFNRFMPQTLLGVDSYTLAAAFKEYWAREFAGLYQDEAATDQSPVVPAGDTPANDAALAEREATFAGDGPPPEQPADTDMEADEGTPAHVSPDTHSPLPGPDGAGREPAYREGPCFACDGQGTVPGATEGQRDTCNLCEGTGRVQVPVRL